MRVCNRLKNINSVSGKLGERHFDLSQQPLDVRFRNTLGGELRRLDVSVEKGDG